MSEENLQVQQLREWFQVNGGVIHRDISFISDSKGLSVKAKQALQSNTMVVSCPFSLTITLETTQKPLHFLCGSTPFEQTILSERQRICMYISLHWIIPEEEDEKYNLRHRPYVNVLPKPEQLLTPLYFDKEELELFKGTNIYGATLDQRATWINEYQSLRNIIAERSPNISDKFSYDMYQRAATYLSSRAFPSSLLSGTPSLVTSPLSYPVLLPVVDSLNHKRGQPVTWAVSHAESIPSFTFDTTPSANLCIGLTINARSSEGEELFNNYGPKPNSSLILGYGFTLPNNPDDTIMLKIGSTGGGSSSMGHEVGRDARGADALWKDVRGIVASEYGDDDDSKRNAAHELQIDMETSGTLSDMVSSLASRLPDPTSGTPSSARREVQTMWKHYTQGQKDILETLLIWLEEKEKDTLRKADELGIHIVDDIMEEDEEEE